MIKVKTNNWGWKIFSFLLALLLWWAVVNAEDPQVSTTIRGIPVEKQNENAITSQKQAIQYVAGDTVDVKVKGKRSLVYKLTQSNIKAYADMKNLSITGAVDIQLELPNEIELISKSPSSVSVNLEKIITRQFEIQYEKEGKPKLGYVDLSPVIVPSVAKIEAAESTMYKIEKVVVPVNIEGISGDFTTSVTPLIYGYSGDLVNGLKTNLENVQVKIPVEKTKTIPIEFKPKGDVGENYSYLGTTLSEDVLSVRGKQELIDRLQVLVVDTIDISTLTNNETVTLNLAKLLPDGISLNQDRTSITAEIQIEEIITREFSYSVEQVQVEEVEADKQVTIVSEGPITVTVKGLKSRSDELNQDEIIPFLSAGDKSNGVHSIAVSWKIPEGVQRVSPDAQLTVEIADKESN